MEADRAPTPTSHWGLALWRRGVAERTHEVLASPPKDQSWGPDSIVLRLGPGVMIHQRTGRTDDMRAWSHRPRLSPTRSSTRGTDGSRPPTSATIGGRDPRSRAATAGDEFPRTGLTPGIAEPPNDPHWRTARGCPPEARTTWPSAPWGFGRRADLAARARHPPRPDLA